MSKPQPPNEMIYWESYIVIVTEITILLKMFHNSQQNDENTLSEHPSLLETWML